MERRTATATAITMRNAIPTMAHVAGLVDGASSFGVSDATVEVEDVLADVDEAVTFEVATDACFGSWSAKKIGFPIAV